MKCDDIGHPKSRDVSPHLTSVRVARRVTRIRISHSNPGLDTITDRRTLGATAISDW